MEDKRDVSSYGMEALSKLGVRERNILVGYVQQEGFGLLQRMMEDALKVLNQKLIKATGKEEIVAAHAQVNGANDFYHLVLQMLQEETTIHNSEFSNVGSIENPERPYYPIEFEGQENL